MHFLNFSFSEYTFKIYYCHVYGVYACVCVFACMCAHAKAHIFGYLKTIFSSYSHAFLKELLCMHVGDGSGAETEKNIGSPEAGVRRMDELPDVDAGNQTRVLWKSPRQLQH